MNNVFMRYATPFITGLFVVSLVSGVALFFHIGQSYFHGMHEWLSMVLILPFILHLARNWRPFLNYFRRLPMAIALGISVLAAAGFTAQSLGGSGGGNPISGVVQAMGKSSLETVAPVFGKPVADVHSTLVAKGYQIENDQMSLEEIAAKSGKDSFDLIRELSQISK